MTHFSNSSSASRKSRPIFLLTLQLAQLAEEAQLSQLVDAALQAFTLADFVKRLEQLIVGQTPKPAS